MNKTYFIKPCLVFFVFLLLCTSFLLEASVASESEVMKEGEEELLFTFLHTNDEHSALIPSPAVDYHREEEIPTLGGIARLSYLVNSIRESKKEASEPVMVLSGGDFIGGTVYNWLTFEGYAPEISLMQKVGYDVVAIGNHEFDFGPETLADYLLAGGYPRANDETKLLLSNVEIPPEHLLAQAEIADLHIEELENGLKIGFFSVMGRDARNVTVDVTGISFGDVTETARRSSASLKEMGAHIIVALNHAGIDEDRELAANVDGIDIIVGGHSHTEIEDAEVVNDTIIVQAGANWENLGVLELAYNPESKNVRVRNHDNNTPFLIPLDYTVPEDDKIREAVAEYTNLIEGLIHRMTDGEFRSIFETVAFSDFILPNHPHDEENAFGNFVTDAMRFGVEKVTGERVDLAFQGSGIIRSSIYPGIMDYSRGAISLYDITQAVALGSGPEGSAGFPLASAYLTAEEIRRILEISLIANQHLGDNYFLQVSGMRFSYDPQRVILFPIPGFSLPFPSTRAITRAELYSGTGIQSETESDYIALKPRGDRLYKVVTDYVLFSRAVEEAARQLPWLPVVPKDKDGNPIENPEDCIVRKADNSEYKVWQAVLSHFAAQPAGPHGYPQVDPRYNESGSRIIVVDDTPPLTWIYIYATAFYTFLKPVLAGLLIIIAVVIFIVARRRKRATTSIS